MTHPNTTPSTFCSWADEIDEDEAIHIRTPADISQYWKERLKKALVKYTNSDHHIIPQVVNPRVIELKTRLKKYKTELKIINNTPIVVNVYGSYIERRAAHFSAKNEAGKRMVELINMIYDLEYELSTISSS